MGKELTSFLLRHGECDNICKNIILRKVKIFIYPCNLEFLNVDVHFELQILIY